MLILFASEDFLTLIIFLWGGANACVPEELWRK